MVVRIKIEIRLEIFLQLLIIHYQIVVELRKICFDVEFGRLSQTLDFDRLFYIFSNLTKNFKGEVLFSCRRFGRKFRDAVVM